MAKRYYWLKLKDNFFSSKQMKKLRRVAGGDTYTVIYLKLLLKAMRNDGVIAFEGIESSVAEEIALDIDEQSEDVQMTLSFLTNCGLAELGADNSCFLPEAVSNCGSECDSAERVRKLREKRGQLSLPVTSALSCNGEALQSNSEVTQRKEIEKRGKKGDGESRPGKPPRTHFIPPTAEEVQAYCTERHNNIDPQRFVDYYTANGWVQGKGKPVKDWKACVRTWERNGMNGRSSDRNSTADAAAEKIPGVLEL